MDLFRKIMGEALFTPLSVSTQVVAGLNYRFRCIYDDGTVNSPSHCSVTIWQPLQGEIQDDYRIEKGKAHIETVKACERLGILTLKKPGKRPALSLPDQNAGATGTLIHEEGYIPETYRCLGYIKGWFLIEVDAKAGFIRDGLVTWDAINTF